MNYWLFKTEPGYFSFNDLKNRPNMTEAWNIILAMGGLKSR